MSLSSKSPQTSSSSLLLLASVVIIVAGLKAASSVLAPIMLAFFIATVSYPMTSWLIGKKTPKGLAVTLTVLVDFAFLIGLGLISIALLGDLQDKWSSTYYDLLTSKVGLWTDSLQKFLASVGNEEMSDIIQQSQDGTASLMTIVVNEIDQVLNVVDVEKIWSLGTNVFSSVLSFFGGVLVVLVLTIFMIAEAGDYGSRVNLILQSHGPNLKRVLSASKDIQRFMGIKTLASLLTGLLAGFLCYFSGLDFFILFGVLTFLLNYIPVVGSIIAAVPAVLLGLLIGGAPIGLMVLAGYSGINIFIGNFLEPMMTGSRLGVSTLVVILSVMFWGWVWGPVGMLLAVPITMLIKAMLNCSEDLRWLSVAITKTTPEKLAKAKCADSLDEVIEPDKVVH